MAQKSIDDCGFGEQIDRLDNFIGALQLPIPDRMHVDQLRKALPEISAALKQAYEDLSGENPWAEGA